MSAPAPIRPLAAADRTSHFPGRFDAYERYELKFHLPIEYRDELRRALAASAVHDRHCAGLVDHRYTVRSIYFDTRDLHFYCEKLESVKVRKKLRVRTYNLREDDCSAFLEIKRKRGKRGYKERLGLPLPVVDDALNGTHPDKIVGGRPFGDRKMLERFRFNLRVRHLNPVVLVTYEREAFVGIGNERERVTFDGNLRSRIEPELDDIFAERELRHIQNESFILELKFDGKMPRWMATLMRDFDLRPQSYSKYCQGIDAWAPRPK